VLDIGCGSGTLARRIMALRPDVSIEGIDVLVRPGTEIPVTEFDGDTIPWADGHFDIALFVDVLHHTEAPARLLAEAKRVSKGGIVIKDHFREGVLAEATLRFMDWVGNAQHGVVLPYNYLSDGEWRGIWSKLGLKVERLTDKVGLYPAPFSWLFDRRLHFVARLA
jgi:SAM-dependent methyltransferase